MPVTLGLQIHCPLRLLHASVAEPPMLQSQAEIQSDATVKWEHAYFDTDISKGF